MNNKIWMAICIALLSLGACKETNEKSCCKKEAVVTEVAKASIGSESIFNLESKWVQQNKDSIFLKGLSQKITIAAMVFTRCQSACPRIVADMQRIEKSFTKEDLRHITFLLISMDPVHDTPERFSAFAQEHGLNDNWICISSSEDATMELANVLNVRIKKLANGGFDHSNTIHLIDRAGNIIFQQNGLAQDPSEIIAKAQTLTK